MGASLFLLTHALRCPPLLSPGAPTCFCAAAWSLVVEGLGAGQGCKYANLGIQCSPSFFPAASTGPRTSRGKGIGEANSECPCICETQQSPSGEPNLSPHLLVEGDGCLSPQMPRSQPAAFQSAAAPKTLSVLVFMLDSGCREDQEKLSRPLRSDAPRGQGVLFCTPSTCTSTWLRVSAQQMFVK